MTAASKNKSLNFILFISFQMSYNLIEVGAFAPSSHLRACIRLANPAMNVPKAIRSLIINSIRFFCFFFFLLILFSPPEYNIPYGVPYVNIYFKKDEKNIGRHHPDVVPLHCYYLTTSKTKKTKKLLKII